MITQRITDRDLGIAATEDDLEQYGLLLLDACTKRGVKVDIRREENREHRVLVALHAWALTDADTFAECKRAALADL